MVWAAIAPIFRIAYSVCAQTASPRNVHSILRLTRQPGPQALAAPALFLFCCSSLPALLATTSNKKHVLGEHSPPNLPAGSSPAASSIAAPPINPTMAYGGRRKEHLQLNYATICSSVHVLI